MKQQEQMMQLVSTGHIWIKEEVEGTTNLQKEFNNYLDRFNSIISYAAQIYGFYHEIDRLVAQLGTYIHQMIGSAYNLAMEQKLVTRNPTQGCALPKVEHKEMKTLTADQLSAFFQEARDSGVYELYYLDLATGLRRGELLGLKWTDVDLDRGVLKIQRAISRQNGKVVEAPLKTKNAYRTLPLSAYLC